MQSQSTTIIIADDHPLFRGALRQSVASIMPGARVMEASGMDELNATLSQERDVDLILLDLTMPGVQGFSGLMSLRAQYPELPVVIVSATEEPTVIRRAMDFGASGFIPKSIDIDSIGGAIKAVLAGDTWTPPDVDLSATEDAETADLVRRLGTLTPQQVRVLTMLSEGLLNKQIAYELGVSEATVKAHVSAILDKLGVDSRTQAVIAASKIGVTQRPSQAGAD
ncbi:response regulator transcription factor [Microvirga sp. CF3062]|uniref:response regulator transcription factor n=1 Tax=Microvirga sp. CF3062 TaxID=3110182 RepID=UPI002E77A341|nr:response regulator transcription factor [Microvirga sp. CF3062]MEE1657425.1 response regulator transcription factor [Microvirga sp. CF3062]